MSSDLWAAFGTEDVQPTAPSKSNPPRSANILFDQETEQDEADEFGDFEEGEDDFGDFEEAEHYMASAPTSAPVINKPEINLPTIRTQAAAPTPKTLPSADLSLSELVIINLTENTAYTHAVD